MKFYIILRVIKYFLLPFIDLFIARVYLIYIL